MPVEGYAIEPLAARHLRETFDCGVPVLDDYLRKYVRQDVDRGVAAAYVAVPVEGSGTIAGFYTLASTGVRLSDLPPAAGKKLPGYPLIPTTLLGRLAVSIDHRRLGLGEWLLLDALKRSLDASAAVGSAAVIVDAKDESSAAFYRRYGFEPFPTEPRRLFLPMKTIATVFS